MERKKILMIVGGVVGAIILIYIMIALLKPKATVISTVVQNATICSSVDENNLPLDSTNVFATDTQKIWLSARVINAQEGTSIKIGWSNPSKKLIQPTTDIGFSSPQTKYFSSELIKPENLSLWPLGEYKVVIALNNQVVQTLMFTIKKPEDIQHTEASAHLSDIKLTTSVDLSSRGVGENLSTLSPADDQIYLSMLMNNPQGKTNITTKWYDAQTRKMFFTVDKTVDTTQYVDFYIDRFKDSNNPQKLWGTGQYYIEIYLDDVYVTRVDYLIQNNSAN